MSKGSNSEHHDVIVDRAGLSPIGSAPSALSASGAERSEEYGSWLSTPTTTGGTPSAQQPDDDAETSPEVRRDFGCNSGGFGHLFRRLLRDFG